MLTQSEARELIAMEKRFADPSPISLRGGEKQVHDLRAIGGRERFLMDMWRGSIRLTKANFQTRTRVSLILVRLDVGGAPHTNPDGERIGGDHLHVYREGFEDRWAKPLDADEFGDPSSLAQCFADFCRYCNVSKRPQFQESLV